MFGIGGGEILIIAVIAVVLFGTDDLPQNLRKFMKMWNDFRGATNDLQRGWFDVRDRVTRDILNEGTNASPMIESGESKTNGQLPEAEGLTENTIVDNSQESMLPVPRRSDGSIAVGEELPLTDVEQSADDAHIGVEGVEAKINSGSDKST